MQVTETLSEGLKRAFTVVVPAADIESRKTERLTTLGKTLRLPGFRPGKVPLPVVRQRYGTAVSAEVLEESVNNATRQMLSERGLRPAQQPKVDLVTGDPATGTAGQDLEFKLEFELLPEIPIPDFAGMTLSRPTVEVDAAAIDAMLANLAQANRDLVDFTEEDLAARGENSGATSGDVLTVDFVGKLDGTEFPGGAATDAHVDIGGTGFIPGFAEQLEGMRPGDVRTIEVTFPADYSTETLAGKLATFDVTAKALRKPSIPAVDDALAAKVGVENLEALRQIFVGRSQQEYQSLARMRLKRQLLDELAKVAVFEAPEGIVEQEFSQIWQRLEADRKAGTLDADDAAKDDETLKAEYWAIAMRRVRLGLLLAEIGRVNNIAVTPEELTRAMREQAARYPGQEAQMMEFFRNYPQATESLRGPIFEEKVVDYVLELAKVEDQPMTPAELLADPALAAPTAPSETPTQPADPAATDGATAESAATEGAVAASAESEAPQPE